MHAEVIEAAHDALLDLQSQGLQCAHRGKQQTWLGGAANLYPGVVVSSLDVELQDRWLGFLDSRPVDKI